MSSGSKRLQYYGNNPTSYSNSKKAWSIYTNFGKDDIKYYPYYNRFGKSKYKEYYWELIQYLRDVTEIYPNDYHFAGMYYERTTKTVEEMFTMSVHKDDSVSFNYYNACVDHHIIRTKIKDVFKIFNKRGDALKFIQYCMKCFSTAALLE